MHIGIDGRFIQGPNTGVTNYLVNLLKCLGRQDKKNLYSIYLSDADYRCKVPVCDNFSIKVNKSPSLVWKNVWLPQEVRRTFVDLVHFPAYTGAFTNIGNNVVTIHDLIHKVNPKWFSRRDLILLDIPIQLAIKKATKIIAVSENTKKDIIKYYKVNPERIAVTLEAADSSFRKIEDQTLLEGFRKKYNLNEEFILYVGVLFKRRNVDRLLKAFSILKHAKKVKEKLVLVGPERKNFDLKSYIEKFKIKDDVVYLGYMDQVDMPLVYNAASFFIYPSLYEGFGLPVLEAMSCAKAVITSNISSLPEVIGDAGLSVDPYNTEEMAEAMFELVKDGLLRRELGKKALERSRKFSWDKMTEETIKIYEEVNKK